LPLRGLTSHLIERIPGHRSEPVREQRIHRNDEFFVSEARSDLLQGNERLDDPYAVHVTSLGQRATMDDEQWRASRSSPAPDVQMDSRIPRPGRPKGQTDPEQLSGRR